MKTEVTKQEYPMPKSTQGFMIYARGDHSVGIPSAQWEIKGSFIFDHPDYLEEFRKEIADIFETIVAGEEVKVMTFEEVAEDQLLELQEERQMDRVQEQVGKIKRSDEENRIYLTGGDY